MFGLIFFAGGRVGYYQGNPLKLTEDCQVLNPTFFPSVPRLYNKIYAKIKASLDGLTGCKGFLAKMAMNSKYYHLQNSASYRSGCYDALVFKKVA